MLAPWLVVTALATCASAERPRISEVFYDAVGEDLGLEFVELFNPSALVQSLAGMRLEAGDGSAPGRWTLRWTGSATDTIAAFGRFVVGGSRMTPAPNAVVSLDLQNGPDAVRLVWATGDVEIVGYGNHEFAEYFCDQAALDVASGQSLARIPDDAPPAGNAVDFRAATPSPGRANRARRDAAWVPSSLVLQPERPSPWAEAALLASVVNAGVEPLAAADLRARLSIAAAEVAAWTASSPLAPGETLMVRVPFRAQAPGRHVLLAVLDVFGDEARDNDRDSALFRSGEGPLAVTEIQFHPAAMEGEWVEVRNRSDAPVDPARFTLSDRGAARGVPAWSLAGLMPGDFAVLAQNRTALLAVFPRIDSSRVAEVKPWPSLNNSNAEDGVADHVVLREDGIECDRVAYSAAGIPGGVPIERAADGSWRGANDPLGSPLAPARELPAIGRSFMVAPAHIRAGGETRIAWSLPWRAYVSVDVFDLAGDRVTRAFGESAVAARGERSWNAAALVPGVYVLRLRARPEGRSEVRSEVAELGASHVLRVQGAGR